MTCAATKVAALGVLLGCALLLVACQPRAGPPAPQAPTGDSPWPAYDYRAAADRGDAVYTLDRAQSRVDILVGKAGALARFGHEHVVMASGIEGYLALSPAGEPIRADLRFDLAGLVVDDPAARRRHGLDPDLDADAIASTRANLMETVLDPARWPYGMLAVTDFEAKEKTTRANVEIFINGNRHRTTTAFELRQEGEHAVVAGQLALSHAELGLEPFSTLGGGLRVADELNVVFRLVGLPPARNEPR